MYYYVLWINAKPNNRMNGAAHLKKLAQIVTDELGLASRVYANVAAGPTNLLGFLTPYESMAAIVNGIDKIGQADAFQAWSEEAEGILDLGTAEWQTFRALRSGGGNESTNFVNTVAIHVTPGKLQPARAMLERLADHIETTYGRPVDILSLEGGLFYRHFVVINYDNLEQYDAVQAALPTDERYAQWTVDMTGLFDNTTIETNIGRYI